MSFTGRLYVQGSACVENRTTGNACIYSPSQPVTSMRKIGFEDNFFAGPAEAERSRKKSNYKETCELETMWERIAVAEKELQGKHELLLDPSVMSDSVRLRELSLESEAAQAAIDQKYAGWAVGKAK